MIEFYNYCPEKTQSNPHYFRWIKAPGALIKRGINDKSEKAFLS
jgi:hypothetical protein